MAKAKVERSAGGVVYRDSEGQMMVVLIATRERAVWGLPKGQIEKHENRLEAALREVREETGLRTEHVADLGSSSIGTETLIVRSYITSSWTTSC
jgi:8-oxo-dGTP diphosphatase